MMKKSLSRVWNNPEKVGGALFPGISVSCVIPAKQVLQSNDKICVSSGISDFLWTGLPEHILFLILLIVTK